MTEENTQLIHDAIKLISEEEAFQLPFQNALFAFFNQHTSSFEKNIQDLGIDVQSDILSEEYDTIVEYGLEILNTAPHLLLMGFSDFLKNHKILKTPFEEAIKIGHRKLKHLEILVEEPSMDNVLQIILPQILPRGYELGINCFVRPHQGKSDLKKSIPKKVNAFRSFPQPVQLIVIQDQDSNDCKILKQDLVNLILTNNPSQPYLVRIACKELENWYLGDIPAIEAIYPTFKTNTRQNKSKYRNPDNTFGANELEKNINNFAKGFASKNIPLHMNLDANRSPSFNQLITGMQGFLN